MAGRSGVAVSTGKLDFAVLTAQHTSRGEEIHRRIRDPFLDKLHIQNRLAITNQRAVHSEIKTPDQATELARMPAEPLALHRYVGHSDRGTKPAFPGGPRFAHPIPRRFHHRVVDFLELHARPAHPYQRDKRSEHFVRAFADMIDARVTHHSLQRKIDKICRTAVNLKHVVDAFPEPLSG